MPLAGAGRWPALDYHCVAAGDLFGVKSVLLAEQPDAVVGLSNVTALAIKHDGCSGYSPLSPAPAWRGTSGAHNYLIAPGERRRAHRDGAGGGENRSSAHHHSSSSTRDSRRGLATRFVWPCARPDTAAAVKDAVGSATAKRTSAAVCRTSNPLRGLA